MPPSQNSEKMLVTSKIALETRRWPGTKKEGKIYTTSSELRNVETRRKIMESEPDMTSKMWRLYGEEEPNHREVHSKTNARRSNGPT